MMTINHHYWEHDYEHYCAKQAEKEVLEFHSWKKGKAFTSGLTMTFQNKANLSPAALFIKTSFSKSSPFPTLKKQSNFLWVNLSFKLASNSKLTSNEHKKCFKNNICLYCDAGDYKLDSCLKKQTIVTSKGHSALTTANTLVAASEKSLEK